MATFHDLKTWPEPFRAVWAGIKTYEVRRNDRNYQVGDLLVLREWNPGHSQYSGRIVRARVTHMIQGEFGLPVDVCVMAIREESRTSPDDERHA